MSTVRVWSMIAMSAFVWPYSVAHAQIANSSNGGSLQSLLINILHFINSTIIPFIIGIGFLYFVWGVFLYFIVGGADEEKRAKGRSYVVSATVGFVAIIIFFGVINMLVSSTGLEGESLQYMPVIPLIGS